MKNIKIINIILTKEEIKQWIRNLIDSSVKIQDEYDKNKFLLYYNKSYVRALKFSKITGPPVNKNDFIGGEILFGFNTKTKIFYYFSKIEFIFKENYSSDYYVQKKLIEEVFEEYEDYKDCKHW